MSHVFQLSDEQYAKLAAYAAQRNQTPETLFQAWVNDLIHDLEEPLSTSIEQADCIVQNLAYTRQRIAHQHI
jgi:hypothetical protein